MRALRTQQPVNGVVMGISAPGRGLVWILSSATPLFLDGELSEVYAIFEDITERKNLETQVKQLAFFDPLTQLPNRRLLNDRLAQALLVSQRSACFGALLVLDLDNFKPLNDQHGHMAGDLLLVEVARRLLDQVRKVDTVARFGGDEFVVILQELGSDAAHSAHQALAIAEKIRAVLAAPYLLQPTAGAPPLEHHCTASVGLALFGPTTPGPTEVLQQADQAMYQAKNDGRNRVHWAPRLQKLLIK
jgi:diguanylate cyclase (GGDEF)-like protein